MFCWSKRRGKRHKSSLWKVYNKRMQEGSMGSPEESAVELHHGNYPPAHSHTVSASALSSTSPIILDLKDMVEWLSSTCLSREQIAMLKKLAKNYETSGECGECIFLPRQIPCPSSSAASPSSSVDISPVYLLAQVLRWPDLQASSAKDLLRLKHLCISQPPPFSSITLKTHLRPEMATSQKKLSHYSLTYNASQPVEAVSPPSSSELECCNPFHWSRELQLDLPSGPRIMPQNASFNQRTSSAEPSKALLNMLHDPPEYHSAETESVKDFSESSSSEVLSPSTKTGISRYACGQVSADSYHHDLDRFCDSPADKKQYYAAAPLPKSRSHHWCMARYWEESVPLGHAHFSVVHPVFSVFYDTPAAQPSQTSLGMSLKSLENPNRAKSTVSLRDKIGLGFQLILDEDERVVIVYNRSNLSLFLSSQYISSMDGEKETRRVVKIPPGYSIKASHLDFVPAQNPTEPSVNNFDSIYISFAKGWGENYKRPHVLNCTCWVEVLLDNVRADVRKIR